MKISIQSEVLKLHQLTISEYVFLKSLYEDLKDFEGLLGEIDSSALEKAGWIKVTNSEGVILRQKALELFEPKDDLCLRFINTFPVKTPTGRYLSPVGLTGMTVENIRKRWNKHFKNDVGAMKKAIEVLEAELKWRRLQNNLEYIHNIETWLNQRDYEKYEYLLTETIEEDTGELM